MKMFRNKIQRLLFLICAFFKKILLFFFILFYFGRKKIEKLKFFFPIYYHFLNNKNPKFSNRMNHNHRYNFDFSRFVLLGGELNVFEISIFYFLIFL